MGKYLLIHQRKRVMMFCLQRPYKLMRKKIITIIFKWINDMNMQFTKNKHKCLIKIRNSNQGNINNTKKNTLVYQIGKYYF